MTDKEKIRDEIERRMNCYDKSGIDIEKYFTVEDEDLLEFIDSMQEKPVSEDLEEAAIQFATDTETEKVDVVKQSSFFWGAIYHKQQMMKDAVICVVEPRYNKEIGRYLSLGIVMNEQIYKAGDIVKLIIIKEDEQ